MANVPEDEVWKLNMIQEIALTRKEHLVTNFDYDYLEEILDYVCTC